MKKPLVLFSLILLSLVNYAQLSGTNLMEAQIGNIPGKEPNDLKTLYDQFNIQYKYAGFRAFARLEQFYTTKSDGNEYIKPTQYSLFYRSRGFEARLGNFYETLGKGLLLRGYEIKNSIFEDRISRVKQGFYKDIRGGYLRYSNKWVEVKALRGRNLVSQLPPDHSDNRIDLVSAGELTFSFSKQHLGGIFLVNENPSQDSRYVDMHAGGSISKSINYYGELAHRVGDRYTFLNFGEDDSYGAYLNLNLSCRNFGVSLEWKDYHNFLIGSGLADPPTLIKEHSYKTLNRSTHVGELLDERGIQLEMFYSLNEHNRFTFNHSQGNNEFGRKFKFSEYFLEWYTEFSSTQLKTFGDWAKDEYKQEKSRIAGGVYVTRKISPKSSISIETEAQQVEKNFGIDPKAENYYAGLIFQHRSMFSAALIWEFTNDEVIADRPSTVSIEKNRNYLSASLSYKPTRNNTIQLFAGQRRGGPACTSGICYEVLDFEGVELRWTKRF